MKTAAKIALGIGSGVIAIGAAVGVGAMAANLSGTPEASPTGNVQGGRNGTGERPGRMDTTQLAATLADKLGVDKTKVEAALTEAMSAAMPAGQTAGTDRTPRNDSGNFTETLARALATKLNLDEAKVLAALSEAMPTADQRGPQGGQPSGQPSAEPNR